jgi:DNA-binding transcriptional MerR regulator
VVGVLALVERARRLGLTLGEILQIVALRRAGSAPCVHVRRLLEQKAADLASLLGSAPGAIVGPHRESLPLDRPSHGWI